ncbi:Imidazole glycerol phosphate synthase subunit HisH 2 [Gammaproteobacteria bacterium]
MEQWFGIVGTEYFSTKEVFAFNGAVLMIVIIDYGMGNFGSILNMLKRIGVSASITSDREQIQKASKIILPGVGSFDSAMNRLLALNVICALEKKVLQEKVPILGICLGMQLLTKKSEEGDVSGLGWIDAVVKKFKPSSEYPNLKVPNMGWNIVKFARTNRLLNQQELDSRFYFVHSYYVSCCNENDVIMTSNYGGDFVAAFEHENIFGVQFHPEKSHRYGIEVFKNFVAI